MSKKDLNENQAKAVISTSIMLGVGLFIALSVVVYFVFPLLLRSEISGLQTHLEQHEKLTAHPSADFELHALESRILLLEAAMYRIDPQFYVSSDSTRR